MVWMSPLAKFLCFIQVITLLYFIIGTFVSGVVASYSVTISRVGAIHISVLYAVRKTASLLAVPSQLHEIDKGFLKNAVTLVQDVMRPLITQQLIG